MNFSNTIFCKVFLIILMPGGFKLNAQQFTFFADPTTGPGGVQVRIDVVDPTLTTGDDYRVTFSEENRQFFFTVLNQTTATIMADRIRLTGYHRLSKASLFQSKSLKVHRSSIF